MRAEHSGVDFEPVLEGSIARRIGFGGVDRVVHRGKGESLAAFSGVFRPPRVRECVGITIESEEQGAEGAARMFRGVSERV